MASWADRTRTQPPLRVEIDDPLLVAVKATCGVFLTLMLLFLVAYLLLGKPNVDSTKVRAICVHHDGVARVDKGTTIMDGLTFVTCRDGWYERADN